MSFNAEASNFSREAKHSDFQNHGFSQFVDVKLKNNKKANTPGGPDQKGIKAGLGSEAQLMTSENPFFSLLIL